nr:hypothetical protein [Tanacetum cinerariifolium]
CPRAGIPRVYASKGRLLPAEEQLLPVAASPTAESPGYIDESDHKDDTEEDPKDDPEEDPADYPANGGEEGDDEDESSDDKEDESSDDDEDEDIDIEGDAKEDEYLAPANSTTDKREEIPEADMPLQKRLCTTHTGTYEL